MAVTEPDVPDHEPPGAPELHGAREDVAEHAVVVALGDVDRVELLLEAREEEVHVPPLPARHLREEVLHVPEDDEGLRAVFGREGLDLPRHLLRLGRDVHARLRELFLEADVEVRDRKGAPADEEGGVVGDRPEIHRTSQRIISA